MKYEVREGVLLWGARTLGPADLMYVDGHEGTLARTAKQKGMVVRSLPVGDLVVMAGGRVMGVESKKAGDLVTSLRSRRLQRQLRQLREAVDVPVLGLRLSRDCERDTYALGGGKCAWVAKELFKWAALGGLVAILPVEDEGVLVQVQYMAGVVAGHKNPLSVLAGTDRKRPEALTPFRRAMQRLFVGVGPKLAARLEQQYQGDFLAALAGEWPGVPAGVRAQRDTLVGRA